MPIIEHSDIPLPAVVDHRRERVLVSHEEGPYLSTEGADYLARSGVNAVAVDFPINKLPATPQSTIDDFPVHRLLLGQNIPLIENLINLDRLVGRDFELWVLPIKLKGGDGGATRAVARIL